MKRQKMPYYVNGQRNMSRCIKAKFSELPLTPGFFTPMTKLGHGVI
jgi:hypothetical protein